MLHAGPPTLEIGDVNNCPAAADITHDGLDDIGVCTPTQGFTSTVRWEARKRSTNIGPGYPGRTRW